VFCIYLLYDGQSPREEDCICICSHVYTLCKNSAKFGYIVIQLKCKCKVFVIIFLIGTLIKGILFCNEVESTIMFLSLAISEGYIALSATLAHTAV
jgi:hypothetical protein